MKLQFNELYRALGSRGGIITIDENLTVGKIVVGLIPYAFALSGISLFVYLIWGGLDLMLSRGEPKGVQSAQGKITNALVGFVIIFVAYWIVQIVSTILGVDSVINIF